MTNKKRECDGCERCCFTHTVKSFDETVTNAMEWCGYCERGVGCRVYDSILKPHGCDTYVCAWLKGTVSYELYPKMTNVVIDFDVLSLGATVFIMEAAPGALLHPAVKAFEAEQLRLGHFVARRHIDGQRVLVIPSSQHVSDEYVQQMERAKTVVEFAP